MQWTSEGNNVTLKVTKSRVFLMGLLELFMRVLGLLLLFVWFYYFSLAVREDKDWTYLFSVDLFTTYFNGTVTDAVAQFVPWYCYYFLFYIHIQTGKYTIDSENRHPIIFNNLGMGIDNINPLLEGSVDCFSINGKIQVISGIMFVIGMMLQGFNLVWKATKSLSISV